MNESVIEWTGVIVLIALAVALAGFAVWVAALLVRFIGDRVENMWKLRHKGYLGAVHEILQDPDRNGIQKVNEAFAMTRHGLRGQGMTAEETEHGRACPACGQPVRTVW